MSNLLWRLSEKFRDSPHLDEKGNSMVKQKKMWELQHTTICKVVGMSLDVGDLRKIARKFVLRNLDPRADEEFVLHSSIVRWCGEESKISVYVQKLIEKRFSMYSSRLSRENLSEIAELAINDHADSRVPLWAILWYVATRNFPDGERIQTALFGFIHMLEHRLVKDFWNRATSVHDRREAELKEQNNRLASELSGLRSLNRTLERENQGLTMRLAQASAVHAAPSPAAAVQREDTRFLNRRIEKLKLLLDEAREKGRELEEECRSSEKQIEALTQELLSREALDFGSDDSPTERPCPCPLRNCLEGKRIAMVGGIDSLEAHYRGLVERSGGVFCRHNGACSRGERKLDECIRNADLVVCPISVNSHFGATGVKRVCKRHGISCCFPDSAGVASLRSILVEHFGTEEVISEESAQASGE